MTFEYNGGQKRGRISAQNKAPQVWINFNTELDKAIQEVYPRSKKQTKPVEPEWATRLDEWGASKEIQELDEEYKKTYDETRNR